VPPNEPTVALATTDARAGCEAMEIAMQSA
jgi:hypothetical protein